MPVLHLTLNTFDFGKGSKKLQGIIDLGGFFFFGVGVVVTLPPSKEKHVRLSCMRKQRAIQARRNAIWPLPIALLFLKSPRW